MVTVMTRPDSDNQVGRIRRTWRSRWAWWAALGLVIAALVIAVALGLAGGENPTTSVASPQPGHPQPSDHDLTIPTTPVKGLQWLPVPGVVDLTVPDGGTRYGPTVRDEAQQLFTGYARTPRGALVALYDIDIRHLVLGDWKPTAEQQTTGPGKNDWLMFRSRLDATPPADGYCTVVGFRYLSWTPDAAVIDYASACNDGSLQSSTLTAVWENGDWRERLLAGGVATPNHATLDNLAGYVEFGDLGTRAGPVRG